MTDIEYRDIENHKEMHNYFTQRITNMLQIENKLDYNIKREFIALLGNWLLKHVIEEDKKYAV